MGANIVSISVMACVSLRSIAMLIEARAFRHRMRILLISSKTFLQ